MALASTIDLNGIRVDHIGSLVRPEKLKQVFARYDRGRATQEELKKAQDEAIRDVIRKHKTTACRSSQTANFAATASKKVFPNA